MNYPFKVWGFGEGIALEALWDAAHQLGEARYRGFVLDLFEQWLGRPLVEADHSAPGLLLLAAYRYTNDERYLDRAHSLAAHMSTLPRDASGAAFHRPQHPDYHHYIYVDCMEVDAPFLCQLAAVTGEQQFYDCATHQILSYCVLLQDAETSLFYHQYDGETRQVNGAFWGRGNGWALLGLLKTLTLLPTDHPDYPEIRSRFQRLAEALARYQLATGDWATVINQPGTYTESSLPAMFGYGIRRGIMEDLLSTDYAHIVETAWHKMRVRMADGLLGGVSVATPPGTAKHYNTIKTGSGYPWGQGPSLLFALTYG